MMSCHVPNGKSLSVQPCSGCCSCHLRWCCTTQMATSLSTPAFAKTSCSLGLTNYATNGHGDVEHVLSMQKGSRYALNASSKTCSRTSSDAFFLRPYLTREEYIYWNSHFNHTQPKCACQACNSSTESTTTMIYQQKHSPASIPSFTGIPSTAGTPSTGFIAPHNHGFADYVCRQARETELCHIPKTSDFIGKGGGKNADCSPLQYPTTHCITERSDNDYSSKEKPIVGKSSSKKMALSASQLDMYYQNLSVNYINSSRRCGTQHETTSKSLRRLSEKYLCGDKSFDEIPHALTSKATSKDNTIKRSARSSPVLCDSTRTSGLRLEEKLSNSNTLKRKNRRESEHGRDNPKGKRLTVENDVSDLHQPQSLNGTIDLNECLTQYLSGSFPENDRKIRIKTSIPQSTKISQTYGIGDGVERASDACQSDKLTPKDYSKRAGSGKVNKVIHTAQPIQRTLSNDIENTVSFGYALDYDCLPKVVGVMSSKQDVVIPGFRKQVR